MSRVSKLRELADRALDRALDISEKQYNAQAQSDAIRAAAAASDAYELARHNAIALPTDPADRLPGDLCAACEHERCRHADYTGHCSDGCTCPGFVEPEERTS